MPELAHGGVDGRPIHLTWRDGGVDHVAGLAFDQVPDLGPGGGAAIRGGGERAGLHGEPPCLPSTDGKLLCSAIVALVTDDPSTFSDMHRLPTDEIWHFYRGDPIELLLLHRDGRDELVVLRTERPQSCHP